MLERRAAQEQPVGEIEGLRAAWLHAEAIDSLVELNSQCLELLAEQAFAHPVQGNLLLRQVGEIWRTLDEGARRRAAACPYLLLDAGFSDSARWRWLESECVNEATPTACTTFFTVPRAAAVTRQVFMYAWHLARSKNAATQLLVGMPAHCIHLIGGCTLSQIDKLADRHPDWLRPRWPGRVKIWSELLSAAASGEVVALENARMHGLQLLAAESRAASIQALKRGGL